jgi:outer membrane receptor protein involved in Fe transport
MFNELYYRGYGNGSLKPEDAWMTDIGMQWSHAIGRKWDITIKADGFFNWLDNKITSAPSTSDPNIWLPYNIGKVFSAGTDISARASFSSNGWDGSISTEYTLVDAKDKTPDSASSGKQIPYIARHSLTAAGSIGWKGWKLDAVWNMREGRSGSYGDLPGWNTLDISLSRSFRVGREEAGRAMSISLRADNLTDERYELSAGYPMPGRSLMAGISFRL